MRFRWCVAVLRGLSFAVLLVGCRQAAPTGVVLVVVDALRADRLGCYGYGQPTSPSIDAIASEGTRFADAVTAAPWTLPAMGTLMTGLYPAVHGAQKSSNLSAWLKDPGTFKPQDALDGSRTTLAEVLRGKGFATAAFVSGGYTNRIFGFAQGFDAYHDLDFPGSRLSVEAFLAWLDAKRPPRFFAYLHLIETHAPYEFHLPAPLSVFENVNRIYDEELARFRSFDFDPGYRGDANGSLAYLESLGRARTAPDPRDLAHLRALYDRGVAYTDHWIGRLSAGLAQRGLTKRTLLIVTADHGDELYDHGGWQHTKSFYEEVMRVPLVVRGPGVVAGHVVDAQVGHLDVMPTVFDLTGVATDLPMQGISLRPALQGLRIPERPMIGEGSMVPGQQALRADGWKFIRSSSGRELYDLRADPGERLNRCETEPQRCGAMAAQLAAHQAESAALAKRLALPPAPAVKIDAETAERLRALGYHE